jgi:hypothetical protein
MKHSKTEEVDSGDEMEIVLVILKKAPTFSKRKDT